MELDNLKTLWKEQELRENSAGEADILAMLQKRSKSPIAKMKRNLFWELIIILVMYTSMITYYMMADYGRFKELSLMLLIIVIPFILYYYKKNKILTEMECVTCEVRSNLRRQVATLEKYIRFYFIAGSVLAAAAYFITGLIVNSKAGHEFLSNPQSIWTFVGCGVILVIVMIFLNKWYVNKLYGQHVKRLKELLQQTEETL